MSIELLSNAWRRPVYVVQQMTPLLSNEVLHSGLLGADLHPPLAHVHVEADITDLAHDPNPHVHTISKYLTFPFVDIPAARSVELDCGAGGWPPARTMTVTRASFHWKFDIAPVGGNVTWEARYQDTSLPACVVFATGIDPTRDILWHRDTQVVTQEILAEDFLGLSIQNTTAQVLSLAYVFLDFTEVEG